MELAGIDISFLLGLIVLLPALGALFNATVGRYLPRQAVATVAIGAMAAGFFIGVGLIALMMLGGSGGAHPVYPEIHYHAFTWFSVGELTVDFAFALDPLSAVMLMIIMGVGTCIHIYSVGYMWDDPSFGRFFTYLNFFIFAMLCLVLGDNLVLLFLGWEGVGVASYLLIGFWYEDEEKASAGKKAFITNRIGDFAVLIGMFLLFQLTGTLNFEAIEAWVSMLSLEQIAMLSGMLTTICLLFFVGCTGKSAQIPLYVWLPDAMAGPTPVSALIHAATMVTAGVYLIVRMNFLFALAPYAMITIATIGALTAFVAATIATTQYDIKKVLAYSTVSQLGYMFLAVGSGAYFAAIFHLMTHAFFKALLFLGSGSVIHGMHHEQDMRKMGGLKNYMPVTRWTYLIGCMAISGIPIFSGFFSKDEVLWFAASNENVMHGFGAYTWFLWGLGFLTAIMTAFYMFRSYFMTFSGECRADEETKSHIHESPALMTIPLVILAVLATFGGLVGVPHALGGPWFGLDMHGWLYQVISHGEAMYINRLGHGMEVYLLMVATVVGALTAVYAAVVLYGGTDWKLATAARERFGRFHTLVFNKYFVDEAYGATIIRGVRMAGVFCHRVVDELIIDTALVRGAAAMVHWLGTVLRQLQNGDTQRYLAYALLGLALILLLLL
ncbi:MAG: NADH-quinone oxidoreductase subunit L [Bradymonadia bacterium]|jgi:NADH-quinone oxidoreductase subunit L